MDALIGIVSPVYLASPHPGTMQRIVSDIVIHLRTNQVCWSVAATVRSCFLRQTEIDGQRECPPLVSVLHDVTVRRCHNPWPLEEMWAQQSQEVMIALGRNIPI
jgi:hypothetical protein